jgi:hypothetical protein
VAARFEPTTFYSTSNYTIHYTRGAEGKKERDLHERGIVDPKIPYNMIFF